MKWLLTGLVLCSILFAAGCAAAQNSNYTRFDQEIGKAPVVSFVLPADTAIVAQGNSAVSYGDGWDMSTTLQFASGNINVHLLYPSTPINSKLSRAEMRTLLESFRSDMAEAGYFDSPLNISGLTAVSGVLELPGGNQTFVAYQPGIRTLAVIFFDESLPQEIQSSFLSTLQIQTNEDAAASRSVMPAVLSPEASSTQTQEQAKAAVATTPSVQLPPVNGETFSNPSTSRLDLLMKDKGPGADTRTERIGLSLERLNADREAAQERLGQAKENLGP